MFERGWEAEEKERYDHSECLNANATTDACIFLLFVASTRFDRLSQESKAQECRTFVLKDVVHQSILICWPCIS